MAGRTRKRPRVPATRTRTAPKPTFLYHGGVPGLGPGDSILPPAVSGSTIRNRGSLHRDDRVYLTDVLETAAMFAVKYNEHAGGDVYEVVADGPVERDPESVTVMNAYVARSATVLRNLGQPCVCGSGRQLPDCCGGRVSLEMRWASLDPVAVERLAACNALAALPYFVDVAVDADPVAVASEVHGPAHWEQVARNGLHLAAPTSANLRVVFAFALLHDAFRESDGDDVGHGGRAAAWAKQHRDRLENVDLETLCVALRDHTSGCTSTDPTVGACWDADRLDLVRVGVLPRPELMSTRQGVETAEKMAASLELATRLDQSYTRGTLCQ